MKYVLITGANRGIGLELTRRYLGQGEMVFAGVRKPKSATKLQEMTRQHPERLEILYLDLADEGSIKKSRTIVEKFTDHLDILINNAAAHISGESLNSFQADIAIALLKVNAIGPVLLCQEFLPLLQKSPEANVINISSEAGSISKMDRFRGYSYYASKAALNMFTRALAHDPELEGSIVVAIHPGWVQTEIGGPGAQMLPADSAEAIVKVIAGLKPEHTSQFLTWQGENYPW